MIAYKSIFCVLVWKKQVTFVNEKNEEKDHRVVEVPSLLLLFMVKRFMIGKVSFVQPTVRFPSFFVPGYLINPGHKVIEAHVSQPLWPGRIMYLNQTVLKYIFRLSVFSNPLQVTMNLERMVTFLKPRNIYPLDSARRFCEVISKEEISSFILTTLSKA